VSGFHDGSLHIANAALLVPEQRRRRSFTVALNVVNIFIALGGCSGSRWHFPRGGIFVQQDNLEGQAIDP